jgi:hypothetical protein
MRIGDLARSSIGKFGDSPTVERRFTYPRGEETTMSNETTAEVSTTIDAPVAEVWRGLTDPAMIKQYFMGATVRSGLECRQPDHVDRRMAGQTI